MANITAAMVKELREMSGAGMSDCKKALTECDGNMDEAMDFLRKSGAAKAQKKASRIAAEGVCFAVTKDNKTAVVVEVNSETDFVAKNEKFQNFVNAVADQVLAGSATDVDSLLAEKWNADESKTVNEELIEMVATIGEKLSIRRFEKISGDMVVTYVHGGGRIGVEVAASTDNTGDAVKEALFNVAMQIAAMNPTYISRNDISAEEIAKLREITVDSAINDPFSLPKQVLQGLIDAAISEKRWTDEDIAIYEDKKSNMNYLPNFLSEAAKNTLAAIGMETRDSFVNEKIFTGMVEGRVNKQLKEISLMDQVYVRAEDGKQSVEKYLETVDKSIKITKFVRFEVGEGMEKKNEDFAAEVAAQLG